MDVLPPADRPRECVRAALLVAVMLVVGLVPLAFEVAEALLRHLGDASTLLPPLVLRGRVLDITAERVGENWVGFMGVGRSGSSSRYCLHSIYPMTSHFLSGGDVLGKGPHKGPTKQARPSFWRRCRN